MEEKGLTDSNQDAEHLRLLAIFHYVVAGLQALFALFPIIHFLIGAAMVFFPDKLGDAKGEPPALVGLFFMGFAGLWMLFGFTLAVCTFIAGRSLGQRRRHTFCLIIAAIECVTCIPFGTVLGVFTILVLMRPSVKQAFGAA
jgi:hypothetical protein